jgi:hypothetical protein
MFLQTLSLSGLLARASSKLAMIPDFGPFFIIGVGLFLLGLAVATAIYDTWWTPQKARKSQTNILSCQTPVRQPLARRETHQVSACQEQEAYCCSSHCL